MYDLIQRPRRLRRTEGIRRLIRENYVHVDDLIYPIFITHGENIKSEISSLPGNYHWSVDRVLEEVAEIVELRIPGILLFGVPDAKDEIGSAAWAEDGIVQQACQKIKEKYPNLLVITDVCLCQYTDHGHCGRLTKEGEVDNDSTLELLAKTALSHVLAGADMVAPSDMMDGRIAAIRKKLDKNGFSHIPILSYAVKYASNFYGPFRNAAHSAPKQGDRRSYQMDPPNIQEALREARLDVKEGADILMVKPGLAYLDVVKALADNFDLPIACYNVSGEYAMVKAAAEKGWIDEKNVIMEMMVSMKRAGADIIITYFAKEVAKLLQS
ncbi:delta-aminolevulinic acid dehydratase [Anoxybacter fermentans]|uniref:Delta-aminolevulinic acid dehydratase n=1 Tax=Anoxybacter fermentans TaxID=1323375 RepID=A0A3Q9HPJ7_9FIRM|nr:porphobilinogen synthase [Anoxybacter fermentans]AZR72791.1 delta-aminolevulinic acid dehydratase [Anoxybacter fermentans]